MKSPIPFGVGRYSCFGGNAGRSLRLVAALCWIGVPAAAHAQIQLTCPVQWQALSALQQPDIDALLFGVRVRDWKPEFFDDMARKHQECMTKSSAPDSLKKAEWVDIQTRILPNRGLYFETRDQNLKNRQVALGTAQKIDVARQQGIDIPMSNYGTPLEIQLRLRYPERGMSAEVPWTCSKTGVERAGWIDEASIKTLAYYTDVCLQSGNAKAPAAQVQKENLALLTRLYVEIPKFAARVAESARAASPSADTVADLTRTHEQLLAAAQRVAMWPDKNPQWMQAEQDFSKLSRQAKTASCDAAFGRAKFPDEWRSAFYLADWNSAEPFPEFICGAMSKGAQVRYLSGGMFSKAGFEIRGKTGAVQVFVEAQRAAGADPKAPLFVPASATINGDKVTITRQNFRGFMAALIAASMNE